jgi:hypothetical protein
LHNFSPFSVSCCALSFWKLAFVVKVTREKSRIISQTIDRVRRSQLILSGGWEKAKKASKGKSHIVLEAKTWNINLISLISGVLYQINHKYNFPLLFAERQQNSNISNPIMLRRKEWKRRNQKKEISVFYDELTAISCSIAWLLVFQSHKNPTHINSHTSADCLSEGGWKWSESLKRWKTKSANKPNHLLSYLDGFISERDKNIDL